MRYMMIVKATGLSEAGVGYSREYSDAKDAYMRTLAGAGALLAAEALQSSAAGLRISYPMDGGAPEVVAGPFSADQGLVAEYALIDARTEDEALNWALRMPVPAGSGAFEIELRKLEENNDSWRDPRALAMKDDLQDQLHMLRKEGVRHEPGSNGFY